jgi:hypothetical protein
MALKWVEGFESYSNLISFLQYRYASFNGPSSTFQPGRAIGNCLQFNGTSFVTPTFGNTVMWIVGFAFRNVNLGASNINMPVLDIRDLTTAQLTLSYNPSTNVFTLFRGATLLGTGTFVLTPGAWYYVEIEGAINTATGTVTVKVNTVSDITFGPGNTQVSANAYANTIAFRGPAGVGLGGSFQLDDIYINDDTGAANNTFLGDMKVEAVSVIDNGFYSQWDVFPDGTPPFQAVQVLNDGLYISSNTAAQKDAFLTSSLNFITSAIAGVSAVYWARNTDSTTHTIKSLARIAGVDYLSSAITINNTAFKAYQNIWEQDPSTVAAWTVPGVGAASFGVDLNS